MLKKIQVCDAVVALSEGQGHMTENRLYSRLQVWSHPLKLMVTVCLMARPAQEWNHSFVKDQVSTPIVLLW